jgi:pimeloyl-ACP methyl ester carboxylesterase
VNPLYFGTRERRLFAVYEPAAVKGRRTRAAVLCYPWGAEYVYAHHTMRQLAVKLSTCGFHTLRFDYFGTGDSGGEDYEANPAAAAVDIESAIEGLQDIVGVARVALIGLRLGATLAARTAMRRKENIEALVLWDPIVLPEDVAAGMMRSLPARTLMLLTDTQAVENALTGVTAESMSAPIPWVEEATITGAVPVRVIQRIADWLA